MIARGAAVYALLRHVRPLVLNSERIVGRQTKSLGWTVGMRAAVEVLSESGPSTVPQIALQLHLPRQAVQRVVDELRKLGDVVTEPNAAHRRSVLIRLTDDGAEKFAVLKDRELNRLAKLLPTVSPDDLSTAIAVLAALDDDVRALAQEEADHG